MIIIPDERDGEVFFNYNCFIFEVPGDASISCSIPQGGRACDSHCRV